MGLFQTWMGGEAWQRFAREYRGTRPFAMALGPTDLLTQFDWDHLGQTLAAHAADVQVLRRAEGLTKAAPRSLAELRQLFTHDAGIAVRNAELVSERVRAICAAIAEDVPGNQHATVFATPENTHSLGWHFDPDELFIVQLAGSKTHHLRANTVVQAPYTPSGHNLAAYPLETSELLTIELRPGDFLYVPRGWWHMARARHTSLSVSIGVLGAPVPESTRLSPDKRAVLRDRIRKLRARLASVHAAAEKWTTLTFKPQRR